MSLLSQFFPSGGGGLGGGSIPVKIYLVGGGGAGGAGSGPFNGGGGGGAGFGQLLVADNYFLTPGTTYPITIGSGGSGTNSDPAYPCRGANGGNTSFNNPLGILIAYGGGGGGAGGYLPSGTSPGVPGGNGGGGGAGYYSGTGTGGFGLGNVGFANYQVYPASNPQCPYSAGVLMTNTTGINIPLATAFGFCAGFPGGNGINSCPVNPAGPGGGGGTPLGRGRHQFYPAPSPIASPISTNSPGTTSCAWISASCLSSLGPIGQGGSGTFGYTPAAGTAGVAIIQWPAPYGAAPSSPGATNVSPASPGFYTYCFTSSGSITLP